MLHRTTAVGLLVCVLFVLYGGVTGKGVHLSVSSNWEETPNVFELLEAISYLPGDALWRYLKEYPISDAVLSPQEKYELAWNRAKEFASQDHHQALLQYSVASRYFNPTVVSHL